jgi:glucose/arabinose dehydrogenase
MISFLTSTTPAAATASAFPSSAEEGSFRVVALLVFILLFAHPLMAQTPRIALEPLVSNLASPLYLTNAHDGSNRRFIVEQPGRIRVLGPGSATSTASTAPTLFLDISAKVLFGGERGLLGLAFHPQFGTNGRYFVNYTRRPDGATVVAEYTGGSERVLFTVPQPYENHNGGMIEFGPDGLLYIGMGDGGSGNDPENRAQNLSEMLGKMLRINVDVPSSRPAVFASGLRNPWRYSFDRLTGLIYAGDVGQDSREEIDIITPGGNYGWRVWEGTECTGLGPASCSAPGFIQPIADYGHTAPGRCSVIGGYVYRGRQASLPYGAYVYGDYCSGEIFMLKDGIQTVLLKTDMQISSFGEDEAGEVYVVDLNGSVFRITNPDALTASSRGFAADTNAFVASTPGSAVALTTGYTRIQADEGRPLPAGMAIIGFHQRGILVSEAAVPASPLISSGRIFAEIGNGVNTGIALANPNNEAVTVSFYFTDAAGTNIGSGSTVIPANSQMAAFLNENPFGGQSSFLGTFTFTSSLSISAVGLRGFSNERSEFLSTTIPVISIGDAPADAVTIPHFADGGGWATQVLLVNPGDTAIDGNVQFADRGGRVTRTESFNVAPRSSARVVTPGTGTGIQTGSVRITPGVRAMSIFSYKTSGITVTLAGVPALAGGKAFRSYVESSGAVQSGLAIANPSAAAVNVSLDLAGATASVSVPPNGQTSFFLNELPAFAGLPKPFRGIVRVTAATPVVLTSLRGHTNERGEFLISSTPPADESASPASSELLFPQFAEGAGYDTQFILFGVSTSGTTYFFSRNGDPASLLWPL